MLQLYILSNLCSYDKAIRALTPIRTSMKSSDAGVYDSVDMRVETLTKVHSVCNHPQMVQAAVGQSLTRQSLPHYIQIRLLLQQFWPFKV